jgi:2'-hydroxyisoflavone reductase
VGRGDRQLRLLPAHGEASAELLAPKASQYIYISSISAYASNKIVGADETAPLATIPDPTVETMGDNFENYGALKALCEQAAAAAFPGHAAIVRPGYIVGPGDPTDRFTYWPVRASRGGEVLAPGTPGDPVQWIDVRDLAAWLVKLVEDGTSGTFNAIGPERPAKWGEVLDACVAPTKGAASLTWVPVDWLEKNGQGGDEGFPIWAPPTGDTAGLHTWSNARAVKTGLTCRPVAGQPSRRPSPGIRGSRAARSRDERAAGGGQVEGRRATQAPGPHTAQDRSFRRARSRAARQMEGGARPAARLRIAQAFRWV